MAYTWGATELDITAYERIPGEVYFTEHRLVPDPTLANTVRQSVLQGSGRIGKKVHISGWCTLAEFNALETDMYAMTSRTLTITEETGTDFVMTAIIQSGSLILRKQLGVELIFYDVIFLEK